MTAASINGAEAVSTVAPVCWVPNKKEVYWGVASSKQKCTYGGVGATGIIYRGAVVVA